ncbi:MAG: DUF177 domain-containing protein [Bacteroidales bacterium]|nr:DUF177 domain-containing protein [Bacteroidales bacterium]
MVMREQRIENKDFIIQIKGLKTGKYEYDFSVDGAFFRGFENTQILDASLEVKIILERGGGWMNVSSEIEGTVTVECDRCLDDLDLPVDFTASLAVKFAKTDEDPQSDEFLVVDPLDGELDLRQFIYDYVCVNLPLQKVHEEGGCNPQMMAKLSGLDAANVKQESSNETNSPFGALGELLKNKK